MHIFYRHQYQKISKEFLLEFLQGFIMLLHLNISELSLLAEGQFCIAHMVEMLRNNICVLLSWSKSVC